MTPRCCCYLSILLVALTACGQGGGEHELARTTDVYLERQVAEQQREIEQQVPGQIIDQLEWMQGGKRVYTVLSTNTHPLDPSAGVYLSHYEIGIGGARRVWQYLDTIDCREDRLVLGNLIPKLTVRPAGETLPEAVLLAYDLDCRPATGAEPPERRLVLVDTLSGIPLVTVEGYGGKVAEAGTTDFDVQRLEMSGEAAPLAGGITNFDALERLPGTLRREVLDQWTGLLR